MEVHTDQELSFFNLEIELLLEGQTSSADCENYLFHYERGYGEIYFTNVGSCCYYAVLCKEYVKRMHAISYLVLYDYYDRIGIDILYVLLSIIFDFTHLQLFYFI